jgi:hypothetical protein
MLITQENVITFMHWESFVLQRYIVGGTGAVANGGRICKKI